MQELKFQNLYPSFLDDTNHNFSKASLVKKRSFASFQWRISNAIKSFLDNGTQNILSIVTTAFVDNYRMIADVVSQYEIRSLFIIDIEKKEFLDPKKSPFFNYDLIVLKATFLLSHLKWLHKIDAYLESTKAKIIVVGSASDCAELSVYWDNLSYAQSSDLVLSFRSDDMVWTLASLVHYYQDEYAFLDTEYEALSYLAAYLCRLSGDRRYLALLEGTIVRVLSEANLYATRENHSTINKKAMLRALGALDFRVNFLSQSEFREFYDKQILIETKGSVIGQINGLSVIETSGTSYEYGSPVRITATLRVGGDGDVIDIERKAELAGQIHAKAMMIINGYLTKTFASEQPLPVSASLVFEQSYSEIDGDSASLTGLCAVLSCLSKLPIRQDLAVTGAVDQLGHVQPVGGVNEKIEGFFKVCKIQGFSKTQGVIIPLSCVPQLVLRPSIVKAVKEGIFHIYAVSTVEEAAEILMGVPFGNVEQKGTIVAAISEYLANLSQVDQGNSPWWKFWE